MKVLRRVLAFVPVLALVLTSTGAAGPDRIAFPAKWKDGVLYITVDRHDTKQFRELYASSAEAVQAMKDGKPLPYGTVLTLVQYKAQTDAAGTPIKGPDGRFVKGDLIAYTVMEKRQGWGDKYPPELRNGDWEYALFGADGKLNEKANYKGCFECHKPHEKMDYVISLANLKPAATAGAGADVTITAFAFGPNRLTVPPGKAVTWTNTDASPHQVTFTATKARSDVLVKGQSHSQTFSAPGVYDYICGLHPGMKGTVEVK